VSGKSFSSFPSFGVVVRCFGQMIPNHPHHHHPKKSIQENHPKKQSHKIMNHHPNTYAHIKTPTQTHKKKQ
jgi:hypothetical protein